MREENIKKAVKAATEFLARVDALAKERSKVTWKSADRTYYASAVKESGALRRQSMELTRALAEMRKL